MTRIYSFRIRFFSFLGAYATQIKIYFLIRLLVVPFSGNLCRMKGETVKVCDITLHKYNWYIAEVVDIFVTLKENTMMLYVKEN